MNQQKGMYNTENKFKQAFYDPFEIKHRKRTSRAQFKVLEKTFLENPKPSASVRRWLAQQLSMTPRGVQVWFQNRRAKEKASSKKRIESTDMTPSLSGSTDLSTISSPVQSICACANCTTAVKMEESISDELLLLTPFDNPYPTNNFLIQQDWFDHQQFNTDMKLPINNNVNFNMYDNDLLFTNNIDYQQKYSMQHALPDNYSPEFFYRLDEPIFEQNF